jgi:hypothetical protein
MEPNTNPSGKLYVANYESPWHDVIYHNNLLQGLDRVLDVKA